MDVKTIKLDNAARGCLIGLAVGDAVGTTLEFKRKGTFEPISDMVGGGPFNLNAGEWTDDTSMALCLAQSLIRQQSFNPEDQMNRYCNWYRLGYMSSTGTCFDIGYTVSSALREYENNGNPFSGSTHKMSAGNGSLMRLAPIPIFYHNNFDDAIHYAGESSRTTHGAAECIESCQLFTAMILRAFSSQDKRKILIESGFKPYEPKVINLANGSFLTKSYEELTGSGYVIESLESALWCFYHSNSFEEAILLAANIGNDADTTAAICGQIAGAYYGLDGIPQHWKSRLALYDEIDEMAVQLFSRENL
ncbi:ADP-ribosylglycohydrolase family protein [Aliikangiella coralliicola]|uniref:ADP-ribosylglycohydrolase family protein n=1 Tax=Aliikangiella coralliicola TaxID=2592383 RepID=A0A545UEU1_9GAMM|nr:ADP-ribosylglycohydrolase family protein [Aliikangiella coralliicola]TQV87990.1 ADP-ribosylglycohydrolase family protein [Aliikangiella coralliicola]